MTQVLMPRLSDTMTEGVVTQWLKHEGEMVARGDVLAEIETDKASMELEAFEAGILQRILVKPGTVVAIGTPIAVIGDDAPLRGVTTSADASAAAVPSLAQRMPTSPLARSLAAKHGINLADLTGTGPGGRIIRADIESALAVQASPARSPGAPATAARTTNSSAMTDDEQVPLSNIRRVTAQRLTESAAAPHFSLTSTVDAGRLLTLRRELNSDLADTQPRLSVTDLLVRAGAIALRSHPEVNASWGGDHLVRHGHVNVGCAVAVDEGLVVPVVKDADRKSLTEVADEVRTLAERARAGKLTPNELTGGTFTISNLGMYGVDHFTAVINPHEAAILAVGAATDEAVVRGGQVTVATTIRLTLTVDHRVLDGATAAVFLHDLVSVLEHPLRIVT